MKNKIISILIIGILTFGGIAPIIINNTDFSTEIQIAPTVIMFGGSVEENAALNVFNTNFPLAQAFYYPNLSSDFEINANPVLFIGHSSDSGVLFNGIVIPWENILSMIITSGSDNIYFLGCDSSIISLLSAESGKNVISFNQKIDALAGIAYISLQISIKESLGALTLVGFYMDFIERMSQIKENPDITMLMPVLEPGDGGGGSGSNTYPPSVPRNIAGSINSNLVTISWDVPSDLGGAYAVIYEVFRSSSKYGTYERIYTIEDTTAVVAQDYAKTYYYKVKAVTVHGSSSYSNIVTATTQNDPDGSSCNLLIVNNPNTCTGLTTGEFILNAVTTLALLAALIAPIWAATFAHKLEPLTHLALQLGRGTALFSTLMNVITGFTLALNNWQNSGGSGWMLAANIVAVGFNFVKMIGLYHAFMSTLEVASSTTLILLDKGGLLNPASWAVLAVIFIGILINSLLLIDSWLTDWND